MTTPANSAEPVDPDTGRDSAASATDDVESMPADDEAAGGDEPSTTETDRSAGSDRAVIDAVRTDHQVRIDQNVERAPSRAGAREVAAAMCPYLASAGGSWRMASPSRDHRCIGIAPPVSQSPDKQRRHCLSADHVDCGIYRAARDVRAAALAGGADPARIVAADASRRPIPRTAPILLEPPRLLDQAARFQLDRAPGQLALVALMVLAFAIVVLSRISSPSEAASGAPTASAVAVAASGSPSLNPSPIPAASASTAIAPSSGPPASPTASFRSTYTVKKGDSLNSVAARFKTTAAAIQKLNGLTGTRLRIGQVLKIP